MGRKIVGRKHRGIRDPEKQQATRLAALAQKINCPPRDNDEQAIPKSLLRIQELQKRMLKTTHGIKVRKEKRKRTDHKIGLFKRLKGETDKSFLNRVHRQTEEALKEAQFSEKYNVDIIRNKESGQVERVQKRCKDELEEYLKNSKKVKSWKKNMKRLKETEPKLTKSQKKRQKLLAKKQEKLEYIPQPYDKSKQQNEVAFGEVCHAPPTLTLPKILRNNQPKSDSADKPGNRNLLLKSVLHPNSGHVSGQQELAASSDKRARLRKLPVLLRRKIESNQKAAIDSYRQLKASKYKQ